jgi:hypothetical protein
MQVWAPPAEAGGCSICTRPAGRGGWMSKILRHRSEDGRVRRLVQPLSTLVTILRRRTADGRVRRILRSAAASPIAVTVIAPAALESLVRHSGETSAPFEWLTLRLSDVAVPVEWPTQTNKVIGNQILSIEWSALPPPLRVSLERLLASPGKRRTLATPGRVRLLTRG